MTFSSLSSPPYTEMCVNLCSHVVIVYFVILAYIRNIPVTPYYIYSLHLNMHILWSCTGFFLPFFIIFYVFCCISCAFYIHIHSHTHTHISSAYVRSLSWVGVSLNAKYHHHHHHHHFGEKRVHFITLT